MAKKNKQGYRNEYGADQPIDIDELTDEEFVNTIVKTILEDEHGFNKGCYNKTCDTCMWGIHNFKGSCKKSCGDVYRIINNRFCKIAKSVLFNPVESQEEESKAEESQAKCTCASCEFIEDYYGYKFCEAWHNFTNEKRLLP